MNIEYTKTTFETRQKLLKEEEDKCSELTVPRSDILEETAPTGRTQ